MSTAQRRLETKIDKIRKTLMSLGPMRPGSIGKQFRNPKEKTRPFYQLSYTHRMQGRTEYIRAQFAPVVKAQVEEFRRFKKLISSWASLALKHAKLKMELMKKELST